MQKISEDEKTKTVLSLLRWSEDYLRGKGFDNPRLTVELLLAHVLHCTRIDLYRDFEEPLSKNEIAQFKTLFQRRLAHEPLQYVIGETEFMGLSFLVDRRVLIPRPETEIVVEHAIAIIRSLANRPVVSVLDVGTGCGNIAISIAKFVDNVSLTAVDVSQDALEVARTNVERHNAGDRVRLVQHDIFAPLNTISADPFDIILSNPPYISNEEAKNLPLEIIRYEPKRAVMEGGNGLSFFRRIAHVGKQTLSKNGWVLMEFAYNQGPAVVSIFSSKGYHNVAIAKDYDGHDRVVMAQLSS